jgi:hypothetical protein
VIQVDESLHTAIVQKLGLIARPHRYWAQSLASFVLNGGAAPS